MPEYLAPGVYIEEVDSGAKPIEGVSTSTAGFVGLAERGPVDVPVLVTSAGEYERWFGGLLPLAGFADPADPDRAHCYLPHAVQGFFANGGKRAYVVRVAPAEASRAGRFLFDRGDAAGDAATLLLRRAGQGEGAAGTPALYVLDTTGIGAGDSLRIGDGSRAEYIPAAAAPTAATRHVALSQPLRMAHDTTANALSIHAAAPIGAGGTLAAAAPAGAVRIDVASATDLAATAVPFLLELSLGGEADFTPVLAAPVALGGGSFRCELAQPLGQAYPAGHAVAVIASAAGANTLAVPAAPGDMIAFADADIAFAGQVVEFGRGGATHEARRMGELRRLTLAQPLPRPAPAGTRLAHVTLVDDGAIAAKALTAAAGAGQRVLALGNRVGLVPGQVLRIGAGPAEAFGIILAIPGERGAAPDAGTVTLAQGLAAAQPAGAVVRALAAPAFPGGGHAATSLVLPAAAGATEVLVAAGQGWAAGQEMRITTPDGAQSFHRLAASAVPAATGMVTLAAGLGATHAMGETVVERRALIEVQALDAGAWGNRLLVSVEDEPTGLLARAETVALTPPLQMRLTSLTGIEPGTLLEATNPATGGRALLKVRRTDLSNTSVMLDGPGLDAAALAALGPIGGPLVLRSREFRLVLRLRRRPDPAVPSRNTQVLVTEAFRHLSLDHRHSRYLETVVGAIGGPPRLEDRRPEGESALVRLRDLAVDAAATEAIRPGPEALLDVLPSGATEAARFALAGGDDSVATVSDATYLGVDDAEPLARTGLQALRNIPQVSILAVPGQASAALQAGVIAHCEATRDRFAVLDAAAPDQGLGGVQAQRQNFDTRYAALYYPWLTIPDPMPDNLALVRDFALPPSGHVLGVFARTDEERGVHKAPANEVLRGITGLTRRLHKAEQDILNPSPVNINVIRDFRPDGRGIRVWGARCVTSDSDMKYVPVRRLLIFLEESLNRGLQWVVFEPNAEPLWARVRRSASNFLTDVWRSGALEGTKAEEAFFVRCDRTTMTQTDIDNGRLICLIGVAPVKPAEFVIIRIGLFTAGADGS